jgi:hypothetical protein
VLHFRTHIHETPVQEVSVSGEASPTAVIFST